MKRYTLPIALPILLIGCRAADFTLKESVPVSPISKGVVDSFFPDGPTAGYQFVDEVDHGNASMEINLGDGETAPEDGMRFNFLRVPPPGREDHCSFKFELLGKSSKVLQSFPTNVGTSTSGGTFISVWVE
ncbi:MAG TPA: hypothetical protein VL181_08755, partial [Holophagaceae bacterium]|nr:hypothetical protein [Holophagaceae bacterium]